MKLIFLSLFFFTQTVIAQVSASLDIRLPNENGFGSVKYNNPSELGKKVQEEVSDNEISGTTFWKNEWNKAYVFLTSGGIIKINQAKLNLKTNEVYFPDSNNIIKAADESIVNKIIFIDKNDSAKILAVFLKINYDNNSLFQVFNAGEYQLLKAVEISVVKRDYNALLGKYDYAYNSNAVYYLFHSGQISKIDVLNKENLMAFIHLSVQNNTWLTQNKNRLKGETDWVNFLNYYSSKQ
jgi:hypothetical protein